MNTFMLQLEYYLSEYEAVSSLDTSWQMGKSGASFCCLEGKGGQHFDYLFLENIGNLVCPAEFDTGAHKRVMLLSVPEGYDKVYKYPPMFAVVDALIVTKTDYLPLNPDFDMAALHKQARVLNPHLEIFETCARTGEGIPELAEWIVACRKELLG